MKSKVGSMNWCLGVLTRGKSLGDQMGGIPEKVSYGIRKKLKGARGWLVYSLALESYA